MSVVSIRDEGLVRLIAINRPEVGNAIDLEVVLALQQAFADFDVSPQRAAVLHGTGHIFSMGSDPTLPVTELWRCVPTLGVATDKPVITAVNGECKGSAFGISMMADICIADETASFRYPEGIHGATGGLIASLVNRVAHKIAMEVMLSGLPISVQRAYEIGLVNRVVPAGQHIEAALEFASVLARRAPLVLQLMKRMVVNSALPVTPTETMGRTLRALTAVRTSDDSAEGKRAMTEGRAPQFRGQ